MPLAPEYAALFAQLADAPPAPPLTAMPTSDAREMYRAMRPVNPALPINRCEDRTIAGPLGEIPLRIYTPAGSGPFGIVVYFHGGGWVIGDIDTGDAVCREFSHLGNLIVVSVEYRMAPEHVYPAAVDDCYAATQWVADNMKVLNGNGKLGVAGESAGANLAAVMALRARTDKGDENPQARQAGPSIAFQCLLYPVTDYDLTRPSYSENGEGYLLETATMAWFWDTYCPDPSSRIEPDAAPMRAPDLSNLPPALVVTAEFDPLRDEGEAYAQALSAAGNDAEAVRYDGLVHDFLATAATFECSRVGLLATIEELQKRLG